MLLNQNFQTLLNEQINGKINEFQYVIESKIQTLLKDEKINGVIEDTTTNINLNIGDNFLI